MKAFRALVVGFLLTSVLGGLHTGRAQAHTGDKALDLKYNDLYLSLLNQNNQSCCDNGDMHLLHATEDWRVDRDHYSVRLFGNWIEVPDYAIHLNGRIPEEVTQGKAIVWYRRDTGHDTDDGKIKIVCFQPGLQT